jgi:hypothetical protein
MATMVPTSGTQATMAQHTTVQKSTTDMVLSCQYGSC